MSFAAIIVIVLAVLAWLTLFGVIGEGSFFSEFFRAIGPTTAGQPDGDLPDIEAKAGDVLTFGKLNGKQYGEQSGKPIRWLVLDIQEDTAFLIANQYVGRHTYQSDASNVGVTSASTWMGQNDLRPWLNHEFLRSAFDNNERARIVRNDVNDFVSCLTIEEAERYFSSDSERRIQFIYESDMASLKAMQKEYEALDGDNNTLGKLRTAKKKRGLKNSMDNWQEWSRWWLCPTDNQIANKHIPYVAGDGSIKREGRHAAGHLYVRPVIRISIRSK